MIEKRPQFSVLRNPCSSAFIRGQFSVGSIHPQKMHVSPGEKRTKLILEGFAGMRRILPCLFCVLPQLPGNEGPAKLPITLEGGY